ncbi:hypothetical protein ABTE44_19120, partial [Acinetobacter baumannii]
WSHGSIASNTMYRIGFAVHSAAADARRQLLELAAREAFDGCDPALLDVDDGAVSHAVSGGRVAIAELLSDTLRSDALGQQSSITGVSRET